jgi:hypothetical protein
VFIYFDEALIYHLVTTVLSFPDDESRLDRESAILGLFSDGRPFPIERILRDAERLVAICIENRMLRTAHMFYRELGQYEKIVECCLVYPDAFGVLEELLGADGLSYEQSWKIAEGFLKECERFVRLGSDDTARLVQSYFPSMHMRIVGALKDDEVVLRYLDSVAGVVLKYDECVEEGVEGCGDYKRFPKELYHQHVELMAKIRPGSVLRYIRFLTMAYGDDPPFSLDVIVDICMRHNVFDASIFLFEMTRRYTEAVELVTMRYRMAFSMRAARGDLMDILDVGIRVCRQSEAGAWLLLFDAVVECRDEVEFGIITPVSTPVSKSLPISPISAQRDIPEDVLRDGCLLIIGAMIGHVPLHLILDRLLKSHPRPTLGDHRELIMSLFLNYQFERGVNETACRIFGVDFYARRRDYIARYRKGVLLSGAKCGGCRGLGDDEDLLVVFWCGCVYHRRCLEDGKCPVCNVGEVEEEEKKRVMYESLPNGHLIEVWIMKGFIK